jgi:hypothetical protein
MAIQDDWTITYGATKTVEHTSGTDVYTVLEFFQWLAAEFAAAAQMDDEYAFVSDTPTVYRWVNDWAFGAPSTDYKYLKGGSIASSDDNELWSNLYTIGSQEDGTQIYIIQNSVEITPWWGTGNIDILLNVKTGGTLIDGGSVRAMARETDYTYDHNDVDLSGGGRNPVGINNAPDLNYGRLADTGDIYLDVNSVTNFNAGNYVRGLGSGATARINYVDATNGYLYLVMVEDGPFTVSEVIEEGSERGIGDGDGSTTNSGSTAQFDVIAGYGADISLSSFGTYPNDLNNGNGSKNYDVEVTATSGKGVLDVYQYLKYITRRGSVTSINGDDGQEYLSANEATYTAVKGAPFGTFAGGTFFGARGVWIEGTATSAFILVASDNSQQSPPNYQKVACSNTALSGCYVFVAEITGAAGSIIKDQYTIDSVSTNSITVTTSIDINKTPVTGSVRVGDTIYAYTGFSSDTFTGVTPNPTGETGDLYVPLLDVLADAATELSDNLIFGSPFPVRTVVRKYGFKPYTADTTFGANGLTFSPILTVDPQAT